MSYSARPTGQWSSRDQTGDVTSRLRSDQDTKEKGKVTDGSDTGRNRSSVYVGSKRDEERKKKEEELKRQLSKAKETLSREQQDSFAILYKLQEQQQQGIKAIAEGKKMKVKLAAASAVSAQLNTDLTSKAKKVSGHFESIWNTLRDIEELTDLGDEVIPEDQSAGSQTRDVRFMLMRSLANQIGKLETLVHDELCEIERDVSRLNLLTQHHSDS